MTGNALKYNSADIARLPIRTLKTCGQLTVRLAAVSATHRWRPATILPAWKVSKLGPQHSSRLRSDKRDGRCQPRNLWNSHRMPGMKPCIFIHTNEKQIVGALVSKYSFERFAANKHAFDVKLIHTRDH